MAPAEVVTQGFFNRCCADLHLCIQFRSSLVQTKVSGSSVIRSQCINRSAWLTCMRCRSHETQASCPAVSPCCHTRTEPAGIMAGLPGGIAATAFNGFLAL